MCKNSTLFMAIIFLMLSACSSAKNYTIKNIYGLNFDFSVQSARTVIEEANSTIYVEQNQEGYSIVYLPNTSEEMPVPVLPDTSVIIKKASSVVMALASLTGDLGKDEHNKMKVIIEGDDVTDKIVKTAFTTPNKKFREAGFNKLFGFGDDIYLRDITFSSSYKDCPFQVIVGGDVIRLDTGYMGKNHGCLKLSSEEEISKISALVKTGLTLMGHNNAASFSFVYDPWDNPEAMKNWAMILEKSEEWNKAIKKKNNKLSLNASDYLLIEDLLLTQSPFDFMKPLINQMGYKIKKVAIEKVAYPKTQKLPISLYTLFVLERV